MLGFDPLRRSWITVAEAGQGHGRPQPLPRLDGRLTTDPATLAECADDFGHIVSRAPRAVLQPGSIRDIVEMVRYVRRTNLKIAMRGQGHQTDGQAQVDDGVVIDSRALNRIEAVGAGGVWVEAGTTWRALTDRTIAAGFTPPAMTNYLDLSVGGTLSAAGVSGASHRNGAQIDNVLELEVVTGRGELQRCSPSRNGGLFQAVLGGLGQFGIIVRAKLKLERAPALVRLYTLDYDTTDPFFADMKRVALDRRFHHVEAQLVPQTDGSWKPSVMAVAFFDPGSPPNDARLLAGLAHTTAAQMDLPYQAFLARLDPITELQKQLGVWGFPHPWFDVFLPAWATPTYVEDVLSTLTVADTGNGPVLLYPLRRSTHRHPFFRIPRSDEVFYLFDILRTTAPDPAAVQAQVAANRALYEQAKDMDGSRYCIGTIPFTQRDWKEHYGPTWLLFVAAKLAYDPQNVLTPGQGIFSY